MKYLLSFLAIGVVIYFWNAYKAAPTAEPASDNVASAHFNASDLKRLGCNVDSRLAKTSSLEYPLVGKMEAYGLQSNSNCKVSLISTYYKSATYDEGTWAGIRASHKVAAKKKGYEISRSGGNLGEHSEVAEFFKNGSYKGFAYTVQSNGLLRSITIYSDDIRPNEELETIIAEKLYN